MTQSSRAGTMLEARFQRLFLAQGVLAERSLIPSVDVSRRLAATDIDVLIYEYSSGFKLTLRHAECKSGRRVRVLDRALWLNGVRAMLQANSSFLVLQSFSEGAAEFARSLGVDVITVKQLTALEADLNVPEQMWPNLSAFSLFDPVVENWLKIGKPGSASEIERLVRDAIQFIRLDSWRQFRYALLNRLLRTLQLLSNESTRLATETDSMLSCRYTASMLLVRLSQYLLAICHDVSRVPVSDLDKYLFDRLVFGDQDAERSRVIVQNTVQWMSRALNERQVAVPTEINTNRLFKPPTYSEALVELIRILLRNPHESKYLPIAMDTEQFGDEDELSNFPRLRLARNAGRGLVELTKGFAVASLGIRPEVISPIRTDLQIQLNTGGQMSNKATELSRTQAKFNSI